MALTSSVASEPKNTVSIAAIHVPPLVYQNKETGEVTGIAVDTLRNKAQQCNVKIEFIVTPAWRRSYNMAITGEVDGLIPTTYTPERLQHFSFSEDPIATLEPAFIASSGSGIEGYKDLSDFAGKTIAIRAQSIISAGLLHELRENGVKITEKANTHGSLDALLKGEVDLMVATPAVIEYHLGKEAIAHRLKILSPTMAKSPQYLAMNKMKLNSSSSDVANASCLLASN